MLYTQRNMPPGPTHRLVLSCLPSPDGATRGLVCAAAARQEARVRPGETVHDFIRRECPDEARPAPRRRGAPWTI